MMSGRRCSLVGEREAGESRRNQDGGDDRRAMCRLRPGGSRREGERDRDARHRSPGPPRCGGRSEHGNEDDHREQRPRQADRVDAMTEGRLERRDERDPERETRDRPEQRADRADDRAVREQHEPEVLPGRTDRSEHAQLAEPSLSDDGETCRGDERGEQQEDRGYGEHRQRVRPPVAARRPGPHQRGPISQLAKEGAHRAVVGVDEDRDPIRPSRGRGGDERELVAQVTWVLHDADDRPATAVEGNRLPDLEPHERGHAVGDGNFVGSVRVAASAERQARASVRPARVLGTELDLLDAAGNGQRAVADDVDRPETLLGGGETRRQQPGIGAVEPDQLTGRAELGIVRVAPSCRRP